MAAQFQIGDTVRWTSRTNRGPSEIGTIVGMGIEVGCVVYDIELSDGRQLWGFAGQLQTLENAA